MQLRKALNINYHDFPVYNGLIRMKLRSICRKVRTECGLKSLLIPDKCDRHTQDERLLNNTGNPPAKVAPSATMAKKKIATITKRRLMT